MLLLSLAACLSSAIPDPEDTGIGAASPCSRYTGIVSAGTAWTYAWRDGTEGGFEVGVSALDYETGVVELQGTYTQGSGRIDVRSTYTCAENGFFLEATTLDDGTTTQSTVYASSWLLVPHDLDVGSTWEQHIRASVDIGAGPEDIEFDVAWSTGEEEERLELLDDDYWAFHVYESIDGGSESNLWYVGGVGQVQNDALIVTAYTP